MYFEMFDVLALFVGLWGLCVLLGLMRSLLSFEVFDQPFLMQADFNMWLEYGLDQT